jgi:hypothetical protein
MSSPSYLAGGAEARGLFEEFEANLGNTVRCHLKTKNNNNKDPKNSSSMMT